MQRISAPLSLAEALEQKSAEAGGDFSSAKAEIELCEIGINEADVTPPCVPVSPPG